MVPNSVFAFCSAAFFIAFGWIVTTYGNGIAIACVTAALFFAGMSQMLAQGTTRNAIIAAFYAIAVAMIFAIAGWMAMVVTLD